MDEWTEEQLKIMVIGGNGEARKFFKQYGVHEMTSIEQKYNSKGAALYKTALAKKAKAAVDVQILDTSASTREQQADSDGVDGLEELAKLASLDDNAAAASHFQRIAAAPVAVATTITPEGQLEVSRPVVLLGKDAAASTSLSSSSSLQSRAKKSTSSAKRSTRIGATKLSTGGGGGDFDFDDIPFENAPVSAKEAAVADSKQIEDDEALARALQEAEEDRTGGRSTSQFHSTATATVIAPAFEPTSASSATLDKYKNSKSISSANFFGSETTQVDSAHLNKFQGSQSISSDAFYGTGRERASSGEMMGTEAAYQLQQLKSSVSNKANKLKNMTSGFFNDLQTRYS
jgi:ADP-ribosylation factor GTPase-activating protein 2/3